MDSFFYILVIVAFVFFALTDLVLDLLARAAEKALELLGINAKKGDPAPHGGGVEGMLNTSALVVKDFAPHAGTVGMSGKVRVRGELWEAMTSHDPLKPGDTVIIESVDGLVLRVSRQE